MRIVIIMTIIWILLLIRILKDDDKLKMKVVTIYRLLAIIIIIRLILVLVIVNMIILLILIIMIMTLAMV